MILTLIFSGLIILGIIFLKLWENHDFDDLLNVLGGLNVIIGSICLTASIILIVTSYITISSTIQENKLKYESLCKRCEIVKSGYEDVSKSDLIEDIAEWNTKVYNTKYWTNNPWTSWFNPQKIADNLDYIYWDDTFIIRKSEE